MRVREIAVSMRCLCFEARIFRGVFFVFVLKLGSLKSRLHGDFAESVLVMLRCCGDDIGNIRCRCWLIYK